MVGKPKAFEPGRGRQPGDPGGFEPPLPVWRKLGEKKGCATDNDAETPAARAQIRNNNE